MAEGIAREDSSLTLSERMQEFFSSVSEKWLAFADWCQEKGIPLRSVNDFFESKGIPALPVIAVVLLLLAAGVYVVFAGVTAPALKDYGVRVLNADGQPVVNASVTLRFTGPDDAPKTIVELTDLTGRAAFAKVPSSSARISVSAGGDFEPKSSSASIPEGRDSASFDVRLDRAVNQLVYLSISITGPSSADVELLAGNGTLLDSRSGVSSAEFQVQAFQNYSITAKADGYRDEQKIVYIGQANFLLPLRLFRQGEERTTFISVEVLDENGVLPVANATVSLLEEATGVELARGASGEDGKVPVMELPLGQKVLPLANADGFLSRTLSPFTVGEEEVSLSFKLVQRTVENSKNIVASAIGEDGNLVTFPNVELHCNGKLVERASPRNGVAAFDAPDGDECIVAAGKEGFLPVQSRIVSPGEVTLVLQRASSSNSASLVVSTVDESGSAIGGVDVALFSQGNPLGVAPLQTGIDGSVEFQFLPVGNLTIVASTGQLQGTSSVLLEPASVVAEQTANVVLQRASGTVVFKIVDHFTLAELQGATVTVTDSRKIKSSCSTQGGKCTLSAVGGKATAQVSAAGYEKLETAPFEITSGVETQQVIELLPSQVAERSELVFVGIFKKGKKVSALSPSTTYTAKYILRDPGVSFTSAKAFVQVGPREIELENGAASITSFSAGGASGIVGGVDFSLADSFSAIEGGELQQGSLVPLGENGLPIPTQLLEGNSVSPQPSTIGTSNSVSSRKLKWVEFAFGGFEGTRELQVEFETASIEQGSVEFFHRTEYQVVAASGEETLRSPVDSQAGVSFSPLLAQLSQSVSIPVDFEGRCVDSICIEAWLEGSAGKQSAFNAQFEALVPEVFELHVRALSPQVGGGSKPSEAALIVEVPQTELQAVELVEATAGGRRTAAQAGVLSLAVQAGEEAVFKIRALRFSNDASLEFSATGAGSFESVFHLRVVNSRNALKVKLEPQQLKAFEENLLRFTVEDSFGTRVANADVQLIEGDALQELQALEHDANGVYTASVLPVSFGRIEYSVNADGFRKRTGFIPVSASSVVSIEPSTGLSTSAESTQPSKGTSFTVTNLLPSRQVRVNIAAMPSTAPRYSQVAVDFPSFTLKGGESRTVSLIARLNDNVMLVAPKSNTLSESFEGKVTLRARAGQFSQSTNLPFTATASVTQQSLDQLVDYSTDSLDFAVSLPGKRVDYKSFTVTNNAPYPVLVNQQPGLPGVSISPLSATIQPDQSIEFNATGGPSPEFLRDQCVFEETNEEGQLQLTASFQGVRAVKQIALSVQIDSKARCIVPGAVGVIFPVEFNFIFPPGTVASRTQAVDGSQAVKLPTQDLVVFTAGAQVTEQRAYLPAGTGIELPPGFARQHPDGAIEAVFPFDAVVGIPQDAVQSTAQGNRVKFTTRYADIIMPQGLGLAFGPQGSTTFASRSDPARGFRSYGEYQRFGSFLGTRNSYELPAFAPILIVPISAQQGDPFDITYGEEVFIDLPAESEPTVQGNGVRVLFNQCTRVQVYTRTSQRQQLRDTLPAARILSVENAVLDGRFIRIRQGSRVSLSTCSESAGEDELLFETRLIVPLTYVLPPGTPNPQETSMSVNFPQCIELLQLSGNQRSVSKIRRIVFPQNAEVGELLPSGAREVKVEAGDTIGMRPCGAVSPSVSLEGAYGFEVRASDGKEIVFELDEKHIRSAITPRQICLDNRRKEELRPAVGDSYIAGFQGAVISEAFTPSSLSSVRSQTPANAPLSVTKGSECNNRFVLQPQMPPSVHDGTCITEEKEYTGKVIFKAKGRNWASPAVELPVKIVIKSDEKACKRSREVEASLVLRSLSIDYSVDSVNDRDNGNPFVFAFKGTGIGHKRVLTIVNNYDLPFSLSLTGRGVSAVSCQFPSVIQPSEAVAVECTPHAVTQSPQPIVIRAVAPAAGNRQEFSIEKRVNVQVYNGDAKLYSSSPWGEIAPGAGVESSNSGLSSATRLSLASGTTGDESSGTVSQLEKPDESSLSQCFRHYCTYSQAKGSFDEFIKQMAVLADEKTENQQVQLAYCNGEPRTQVKTFALHLANVDRDFSQYISGGVVNVGGYEYKAGSIPAIQGCGIYAVHAKANICTGVQTLGAAASREDRRRGGVIEITGVDKIAECPATVANAPLLLGASAGKLNMYTGKELGMGFPLFKEGFLEGLIDFGPFQQKDSGKDVETGKALLRTIYGGDSVEVSQGDVNPYDSTQFCTKRFAEYAGVITGAQAALGATLVATGWGVGFGAKLIYGAAEGAVLCAASVAGQGIAAGVADRSRDRFACESANDCIRSSLYGVTSGLIPGAGIGGKISTAAQSGGRVAALRAVRQAAIAPTRGRAVGTVLTYVGLTTAATLGADALATSDSPGPSIAPAVNGPTVAPVVRSAFRSSQGVQSTSEFKALFDDFLSRYPGAFTDTPQGEALLRDLVKANKANPGKAVQGLAGRLPAGFAGVEAAGLQASLNAFTKFSQGVKASAIRLALSEVEQDVALLDNVYNDVVATKGRLGLPPRDAALVQTALQRVSRERGVTVQEARVLVGDRLTSAVQAAPAQAVRQTGRFAKLRSAFTNILVHVGVQLVTRADVRPVEARIGTGVKNALVVYHIEDPFSAPELPTLHRMCVENSAGQCVEKFFLASACDSDRDACLLLYNPAGRSVDSLSLFAVVNNPSLQRQPLFDSVMLPWVPPQEYSGLSVASGMLSTQRIAQLASEELEGETGGGAALSRGSKRS